MANNLCPSILRLLLKKVRPDVTKLSVSRNVKLVKNSSYMCTNIKYTFCKYSKIMHTLYIFALSTKAVNIKV